MIGTNSVYSPTTLEYLPYVYRNILEFQELSKSYNSELKLIMDALDNLYNNYHIDSLNEYGCTRWEKILKLKSNDSFSLEDRRFAIKVKLLGHRPYTFFRLKEMLNNIVGEDNYKLNLEVNRNHLICKLNLGVKHQMKTIKDLLDKIVPLNISLETELLYNTHEILGNYTHEYLGGFTHQQLREEVFR